MSKSMPRQGRVWFVTGASSGFGRAVAETVLAALGASGICVLIVDDNVDAATSLSYVLALAGGSAIGNTNHRRRRCR